MQQKHSLLSPRLHSVFSRLKVRRKSGEGEMSQQPRIKSPNADKDVRKRNPVGHGEI